MSFSELTSERSVSKERKAMRVNYYILPLTFCVALWKSSETIQMRTNRSYHFQVQIVRNWLLSVAFGRDTKADRECGSFVMEKGRLPMGFIWKMLAWGSWRCLSRSMTSSIMRGVHLDFSGWPWIESRGGPREGREAVSREAVTDQVLSFLEQLLCGL